MKSTIAPRAAKILDFLALYESRGNYLAYYGHGDSKAPLPATLGGVLQFQSDLVKVRKLASSATGRYQFMPATLRDLMATYNIPASTPFTPDFQDGLACALLEKRGYSKWTSGALSIDGFADNLSMEWASMPYHTGKSYYDGDGLNHSLVSRSAFTAMLSIAAQLSDAPDISIAARATPSAATPVVAEALKIPAQPTAAPSPAPQSVTPNATKETSNMTTAAPATAGPVDFIAGIINTAENFIAGITSSVKVVKAPNNAITVSPNTKSSGVVGSVFGSISDAELAVSELQTVVADAKAGKWANEPADVIALLKTVFSILSRFGISVPVVSSIVAVLPDLAPVAKAA